MNNNAVKRLLKKCYTRPTLQSINYKDGWITITDSYSLVKEKISSSDFKNVAEFNIDAFTMQPKNVVYPSTESIMKDVFKSGYTPVDPKEITMVFKDGNIYYKIKEAYFLKVYVDTALSCIGKTVYGLRSSGNLFISKNEQYFFYDNQKIENAPDGKEIIKEERKQFALTLATRMY